MSSRFSILAYMAFTRTTETFGPVDLKMRLDMTTTFNGTEFVTAPAKARRTSTVTPIRTGLAARRDTRRNRRATRAI